VNSQQYSTVFIGVELSPRLGGHSRGDERGGAPVGGIEAEAYFVNIKLKFAFR